MYNDPIVEQTRKLRDEYAARFNYDLDAICQDLTKGVRLWFLFFAGTRARLRRAICGGGETTACRCPRGVSKKTFKGASLKGVGRL